MTQRVAAALTPEEQAAVMQIQDRVIELFVDRGDAVATGNQARAESLQQEIDGIRMWAAAPPK